jgi:hypothetical protein
VPAAPRSAAVEAERRRICTTSAPAATRAGSPICSTCCSRSRWRTAPSGPIPSVPDMPDVQPVLIEVPESAAVSRGVPKRVTSKGIAAGDIVEVDKKGRRFHALVTELAQLDSGRFELNVRPLDSRISWRTASVREVVAVWRKARAITAM